MVSYADIEEHEGVNEGGEFFVQNVAEQMARGFVEATLYAAVGAAVLSNTEQGIGYNLLDVVLDGSVGGVLAGIAMVFVSKGLSVLSAPLCQSPPCDSTGFFMASSWQKARTLSKWLAQSVIYASATGLGSAIIGSGPSPKEAAITGEVGLAVVVATLVSAVSVITSAVGVRSFFRESASARSPSTASSRLLSSEASGYNPRSSHSSFEDPEEGLAGKNHVMTIMPH